ncbi:SDR family oxidoreductase [Corynebacterium sp. LD5P10]|uniref:3-oxoacyl-[acyl-carrier-protein] reductase MabA n=1 Tax=Corynebacterium kalidii TaxID=2931982 RepID=A0A9X1WHW6_9CORY|nr:SDR family oxidoreductase [Corynebacterium kalidii]
MASACAAEGADVVVNGREPARVEYAVTKLQADAPNSRVSGITADLSVTEAVQSLLVDLGAVDVLVNNVGQFDVRPFMATGDEEWQRYVDVNLMSGVRLARGLLDGMLTRNWGRVIFIGTESAVNVPGDMIHYGATKAASLAVSNGLAKLTRGTGVTVNTVLGGPTYSDGVAHVVEAIASAQAVPTDDLKQDMVPGTSLLQRFIEPEEVADLVTFLASPRSSAINGAALRADGGVLTTLT